jgi:hypoxanthine phosphoribosyltransferase
MQTEMGQTVQLRDKQFDVYLRHEKIRERVIEMAARIDKDYDGKAPLFIAILNGSFIFAAELFLHISIDCSISFVKVASYKGTTSTGNIINLIGLDEKIKDRHVLILEDIVDTGKTLSILLKNLGNSNPASLKVITLLSKPDALVYDIDLPYVGFEIPNDFIVGFGLDYDGLGRNLKHIYKIVE